MNTLVLAPSNYSHDPGRTTADDLRDVEALDIVDELLQGVCDMTGMGFAAIARVTEAEWTAMAVRDTIGFGLKPGDQLDIDYTFCKRITATGTPVVFDSASNDAIYRSDPIASKYGIESYLSVPIVFSDGRGFGTLCAIDVKPARVDTPEMMGQFRLFSRLIAVQLENNRRRALLEAAVLDERAASELREQFIAILGHDLRNPIQGISASTQLLARRHPDNDEIRTFAGRIKSSVTRMTTLIDDVLDLARGRLGGGFGATLRVVDDLGKVLADVVTESRVAHPQHAVVAHIAIDQPVYCDPARIQQLLSNLLGNAFTHGSPDGAIRVTAGIADNVLSLSVANDGNPIPPDSINRVFAPFWRGSTTAPREGLGLGLFICSQVVKAHHGQLSVTSSLEDGTEFTARIPVGIVGDS